ncbi:50S ribosomal protein L19e [Candidatus Micrarchaeota archaeon]|nr:50S ribosomal protein L19e [Candidatus Micrarchaeota archaeon]
MSVATVRRLASDILQVGSNKIRIKPTDIKRAEEALTRSDVLALIKDGIVYKLLARGRRTKEKRRRRGAGHRRGKGTINQKREWMQRVRSQRKYLRELVTSAQIDKKFNRSLYGKVKSGIFKNKKSFYVYIKENNMLNEKK